MNEIYSLSKQRFRNELSDKEMRLKRRAVLEKKYAYNAHLPPKAHKDNHDDAETVVPAVAVKKAAASSATKNESPAKEKPTKQSPSTKDTDTAIPKQPSPNVQSATAETKPPVLNQTEAVIQDTSTPASKPKILPIAAAVIVVLCIIGYLTTQGPDDNEQTQLIANKSSNAQQVDLNEQYSAIVVKQNYSDESIALFLNFWPLANKEQKDIFLVDLDEKILELDPEVSDRVAYLQALIRQSESELVKQTKAIINGAQDNNAFAQLSQTWQGATSAEKNVFIDFISSAYQDYVVDFDNEQNVLVVEAILSQLDITSKVKSVDSPETYANTQVASPEVATLAQEKVPEKVKTEVLLPIKSISQAIKKAPAQQQAELIKPEPDEINEEVSQTNNVNEIQPAISSEIVEKTAVTTVVETLAENVVKTDEQKPDLVTPKDTPAPVKPKPITKIVEDESQKVLTPVVALIKETQTKTTQAGTKTDNKELLTVTSLSAKINALLSKPSLRNAPDSKVLAEATRELYKALRQQYTEQGLSNAKELAKKETFATFEQHERFAYHYYDLELFFTEVNNNEIQADFKTTDAMKSLSKLFNNAETPIRPTEE